jgi:ribonuclease G
MAKEICISSTPHETRLAILEDDQLAEIYYERENEYTLAGSIYNGRVTRVLPGMQSAFVDVGLERDAFLYVTDFLELEDPEESDEIEKAATTGSTQAPREVRQGGDRAEGRSEDRGQRQGQRSEQKQEPRSERSGQEKQGQDRPNQEKRGQDKQGQDRQRRLVVEPADSGETAALESPLTPGQAESAEDDPNDPGAKRWRGRRRRRGGGRGTGETSQEGQPQAGQSGEGQPETDEPASQYPSTAGESAGTSDIRASAADKDAPESWSSPAARSSQSPAAFVLPGESLRKYGGTAEEEPARAAAPAPSRPASAFKPATLIDTPPEWDGSGLLPGESISRHRNRRPEPEPAADAAPSSELAGSFANTVLPEPVQEESVQEEPGQEERAQKEPVHEEPVQEESAQEEESSTGRSSAESTHAESEPAAEHAPEAAPEASDEENNDDEAVADSAVTELAAEELADAPLVHHEEVNEDPFSDDPAEPAAHEAGNAEDEEEFEESESASPESETASPESDASASHHVDPAAPTGFRLFGLGSKKKAEEPAQPPVAAPHAKPATVAAVSAYAPGAGLIEEEVIEGEEFDGAHHHAKSDDGDLEDYEEETLPAQLRTGDLGELLQEAHLDHKIQLNFDDKNVEDESFDEDEDEEEGSAEGQPAGGQGQDSQQRRDRGGRGRRGGGRGAQSGGQGGQGNRRGGGMTRRAAQTSDLPIISDLLKPGQEILVQIAKEPIAKKGARITSHIALPGRFLVFMPTVSHIGVSRKIASDEERQRLKRVLVHERGEATGGFIVRTAAEGASEEELRADLRFLIHLWDEIKTRSDNSKSPALIYHDLSLIERILRDQVSANFSSIWVDSQDDYERIVRFLNRFSPTLVRRVKLYTKEVPLFEHFGIQDEISKALRSKVWLKSGGSIVINQTEALVAIDINTGKYVGKSARLEDTIVKTNLDAVPEIVRQIRLRDLGGIIVIDFIDMDERKNRFRVLAALEEALKADRAPTKVLQFNDFGLVAITRKRVKQSLERTLSVPCPTCQATGMVKSPTTVCNEIYTELRKMKKHFEGADVLLRVNPETVKVLKQNNASWLTEFEELVGKNILVKSDATLHPEQFDIQG